MITQIYESEHFLNFEYDFGMDKETVKKRIPKLEPQVKRQAKPFAGIQQPKLEFLKPMTTSVSETLRKLQGFD